MHSNVSGIGIIMKDSLYDQLKQLQIIPDAKSKWQQYRAEVTDFIISESVTGSLLIVGAGQCNDIDVDRIAEHFTSVTLFDREFDSAIEDKEHRSNVSYINGDILGISDEAYRNLCQEVQGYIAFNMNRFSMEGLADRYITMVSKLYAEAKPIIPFDKNEFDNVVVLGVHSQINNMLAWMWDAYESALGQQDKRVHQYISSENTRIIEAFNDKLFDIAKKHIIIGAEQSRAGMSGAVEGAHQCILDVQRRMNSYSYIDANLAVIDWPFDVDRDIIYQMLIASISV